jgi:hypothetical protein
MLEASKERIPTYSILTCISWKKKLQGLQQVPTEAREPEEWRARTSYARLHVEAMKMSDILFHMRESLSRRVVSRCVGVKLHVGGSWASALSASAQIDSTQASSTTFVGTALSMSLWLC